MTECVVHGGRQHITDDQARLRQELYIGCVRGDASFVHDILDSVKPSDLKKICVELDREGNAASHVAAASGHRAVTNIFISRDCKVDALDRYGRTAMHVSAAGSFCGILSDLFAAGVDPDIPDRINEVALHKAVQADAPDVVDVLLNTCNADPSVANHLGTTPVLLAAQRGQVKCLELLLERDRKLVHAVDCSMWTALHLAAHGDQERRSITRQKQSKYPRVVKLLLENGAALDALDEDKKTPLHRAAHTGNVESCGILVASGADLSAADICRWTPLHYACHEGHVEVAQLLLLAKALVQWENPSCLLPLAVATEAEQTKVAEVLVSFRANPSLGGRGLASPVSIARKDPERYWELLALFDLGYVEPA